MLLRISHRFLYFVEYSIEIMPYEFPLEWFGNAFIIVLKSQNAVFNDREWGEIIECKSFT